MSLLAPAFVTVSPSFTEPGIILPVAQRSGFADTLEGGSPRVRLGEDDLYVYMNRMDIRTQVAGGTAAFNQLPSVSFAFSRFSTPSYLLQVRAEYNHHDVAAAARYNAALPEMYRLGMRQAVNQVLRNMCLYGLNPQLGEGLLNAPGATALNLPADPYNNTTVLTYDNGAMALFLMQQVLAIKTRTNQLGIGHKFTLIGPQRTLGQFEYNIVQVTQYQRPGAGTASTAETTKAVVMSNGDTLLWTYDDTLIGKGAGGADAVILVMTEVDKPVGRGPINTNIFQDLQPSNNACTAMYMDMVAPKEITSPLPGGATDVLAELRATSGWGIRPEAIEIISMIYQ